MKVFSDKRILKICLLAILIFALAILLFYWASGDRLYFEEWSSEVPEAQEMVSNISDGSTVSFEFPVTCDELYSISLYIGTATDRSSGTLIVNLRTADGDPVSEFRTPVSEVEEYSYFTLRFGEPVDLKGKKLKVTVSSEGIKKEQNISLWSYTSFTTGKYSMKDMNNNEYVIDGQTRQGKVCAYISGRNYYLIGKIFWPSAAVLFILFSCYVFSFANRYLEGKDSPDIRLLITAQRYEFLMRQLVGRDFKKKYKRSVLGFGWTILNPFLTMMVQYVVFAKIFKSSVDNFITYLLTGIVLMNFCSESIGLGLSSIVDNAHLINKVYMPKEIYPLSRVISSVINLVLAMIPLIVVAIVSGSPVSRSMLLIPIDLIFLLLFCYGMVLILSTSNALFRDTLFLWTVVSSLWTYMTPIFYPVSIIPVRFLWLYKLNPMYQYITFMRSILIYGEAPAPSNYLGCIMSAMVVFLIGRYVFKKNEDKFILYL